MAQLTTKLKAERIQHQSRLEEPDIRAKLKAERIQQRLEALPGWEPTRDGTALHRVHELPTLRAAALFANLAAEIGASAGHHPTIHLDGRRVTLVVGGGEDGLRTLDFELAELFSLSPGETETSD